MPNSLVPAGVENLGHKGGIGVCSSMMDRIGSCLTWIPALPVVIGCQCIGFGQPFLTTNVCDALIPEIFAQLIDVVQVATRKCAPEIVVIACDTLKP